ncbi:MAG: SPOR domain-containing protein [Thermoleophilia bacterium]|nr:SPOR domain-containing protein [Thermoleophilia bacterium]
MVAAALAAATAALAPAATVDLDPAAVAPGTRLVQIGEYASIEAARAGWDEAAAALGAIMEGKRRVIEPAGTERARFYRLRAEGFADISDARRFCSVFKERFPTCVPAVAR